MNTSTMKRMRVKIAGERPGALYWPLEISPEECIHRGDRCLGFYTEEGLPVTVIVSNLLWIGRYRDGN